MLRSKALARGCPLGHAESESAGPWCPTLRSAYAPGRFDPPTRSHTPHTQRACEELSAIRRCNRGNLELPPNAVGRGRLTSAGNSVSDLRVLAYCRNRRTRKNYSTDFKLSTSSAKLTVQTVQRPHSHSQSSRIHSAFAGSFHAASWRHHNRIEWVTQ